jgi:mono/diheme cytochrome c family protein
MTFSRSDLKMSGYTRTIASTAALVAVTWCTQFPAGARDQQPAADASRASGQAPARASVTPSETFSRYCTSCHNGRLKSGGLAIDALDTARVHEQAEVWEKILRRVRSESMPPAPARRPDKTTYAALTAWLEGELDRAAAPTPNPGRPSLHRLNRAEYANAVRDLLGVEIDPRELLPADDSGYGFDNIADVLSVSPGLLERYMLAASKIGRLAIGDPTMKPTVVTYRTQPLAAQDDRMSEDLPFGTRGGLAVRHQFPTDGEYVVRVRLQRSYVDIIRGLAQPHRLELRLDHALIKSFVVGGAMGGAGVNVQEYLRNADKDLELRVVVKGGSGLVAAAFVKEPVLDEGIFQPRPPMASFEYAGKIDTDPAIDAIEIDGPYNARTPENSPSRRKIFACYPARPSEEAACAERIAGTLARRAYRRPVSAAEIKTLLGLYERGRRDGGFDTGVEWMIERILVDPDFLFRAQHAPAGARVGAVYPLTDLDLASRLSFFLWSSIPDDELLAVASAGRLREAGVLERQVRRMLADDRASALVENFAGQWLWQRNIRMHAPDPNIFPDFDDNLRDALQTETRLFLEAQLRDDRPVLELLTADYSFVNERLARHYGIAGVYGSHFRRVTYDDDRRAGLLGQGSVLTITSYPHRTSPVVRGKWLLENLLGAPPPPPPANIPALPENDEKGVKPSSVRERLEQHRNNAICSSCHARMDPLGFALENFDATGKWRTLSEANTPIDASGMLPDGTTFNGPAEFRAALLAHRGEFIGTLTEKLLTYAIGRGLEYYDMPAVRAIVRQAAGDDFRWSAIVRGIIGSTPFQMSVVPERPARAAAREH